MNICALFVVWNILKPKESFKFFISCSQKEDGGDVATIIVQSPLRTDDQFSYTIRSFPKAFGVWPGPECYFTVCPVAHERHVTGIDYTNLYPLLEMHINPHAV